MIKKSLVCKYKMAGDFLHEDFAVWLQILRDGKTAFGVDEPLLIYRLSAGSKSGNKWKAAKMTYRVYRQDVYKRQTKINTKERIHYYVQTKKKF